MTITVICEPNFMVACGHDYACTTILEGKSEFMRLIFRKTDTQMIGTSKAYSNDGCKENILFDLNDSINTVRMEPWTSPLGVSTKLEQKIANKIGIEYSYSFGYMTPTTASYFLYVIFDRNFNIIGATYSMLDFGERNGEVEFRPRKK